MSKQVLDGNEGYVIVQGQKTDMKPNEVAEAIIESSPFPEINLLNGGATLEKIERIDEIEVYKVRVSDKKVYFYDVETGLKVKEDTTDGNNTSSMFLTDYKEVAGIKFPFKLSQTMGPRKFDFNVIEILLNEGVADTDFE